MKNVLLLKAGDTAPELFRRAGDYDRWFVETAGLASCRFHVVQANRRERLPARPRDFDAVVMTGSPLSVTTPEPWMLRAGEWMCEAAAQRVPVLGVCFGHQLLARTLGVPVVRNPLGREVGAVQISLTPEGMRDPLFHGVPALFQVNATHEDVALGLPPGATCLAHNGNTRIQAFAHGPTLRGVQFHPELSASATRALLQVRAPKLLAEARARRARTQQLLPALLARIGPDLHGPRILQNFLTRF